jgi:hypothetical protein
MALSKSTFVWDGNIGNQAKTVVMGCTAEIRAAALLVSLMAMSDCGAAARSYSARVVLGNTPATGSNSDYRGVAYFQDVATGSNLRITVPGIKSTMVEAVPGREGGERLTDACMTTLQTALQTATGKTLRKLYGVVYQKK